MKWLPLCALAVLTATYGIAADRSELEKIHTVYLLPMANGLDQFLANQLTSLGVFKVTTDPARADAFFTDRVGADFEQRVEDLFPEAKKSESEPSPATPAPAASAATSAPAAAADQESPLAGMTSTPPPPHRAFSRARGTVYLVGRESHVVVWSMFGRPKNTQPKHLDALAEKMVSRIKRDMTEPAKP